MALLLTSVFVRMNGGRIAATHEEVEGEVLLAASSDPSARDAVVDELTQWMRQHVVTQESEAS